jgi:hypothetical protein
LLLVIGTRFRIGGEVAQECAERKGFRCLELLSHPRDVPISELNVMNASKTGKLILHGSLSADFIHRINANDVPGHTLIFVSMMVMMTHLTTLTP